MGKSFYDTMLELPFVYGLLIVQGILYNILMAVLFVVYVLSFIE
jgi:hypothetical protein